MSKIRSISSRPFVREAIESGRTDRADFLRLRCETTPGVAPYIEGWAERFCSLAGDALVGDCMMSTRGFGRRAVVAACAAIAFAVAAGGQNALALSGLAVRDIRVDVSPLRASAGDPTATWVERELPRRLAQALAGRMTPKGGTLIVRIDTLTLGPNSGATIHGGSSPDNIGGVAMIGGRQWPVRATSTYYASPIDQTMVDQSNHYRVSQLVEALTYWLAGDP
jgi:hypothetical protein